MIQENFLASLTNSANPEAVFNLTQVLLTWLLSHGIKIGIILIITSITIRFVKTFISKFLRNLNNKALKFGKGEAKLEEKRLKTLEKVSFAFLKTIIWSVAFMTILPELGIEIAPLLAGLGVGGLALGFGARSLIQDYLSGLFILLEDQYRVGEEIEITGTKGKIRGKIESFNLRITTIRDPENTLHYISNSEIKVISNFARK
ncbi:mechanosensitive ion channel [Candidatus Atribacteria bacterium MT.SAG.1]|nr:mechanosensitive ion channel [Candidatus Atribacteria bacterium MT.SAG.1]